MDGCKSDLRYYRKQSSGHPRHSCRKPGDTCLAVAPASVAIDVSAAYQRRCFILHQHHVIMADAPDRHRHRCRNSPRKSFIAAVPTPQQLINGHVASASGKEIRSFSFPPAVTLPSRFFLRQSVTRNRKNRATSSLGKTQPEMIQQARFCRSL